MNVCIFCKIMVFYYLIISVCLRVSSPVWEHAHLRTFVEAEEGVLSL